MKSGVTSSNKKSECFVWIDGSVPIEQKLLDHILLDGTSREATNVDDIMHIALVDAAVATASLHGSLELRRIHVRLLEPGFETPGENQSYQAEHRSPSSPAWKKTRCAWLVHTEFLHGEWQDDFQPDPYLGSSVWNPAWDIHDLVVEILGHQMSVACRRRHLEDAILDRQKGSAKKCHYPCRRSTRCRKKPPRDLDFRLVASSRTSTCTSPSGEAPARKRDPAGRVFSPR